MKLELIAAVVRCTARRYIAEN